MINSVWCLTTCAMTENLHISLILVVSRVPVKLYPSCWQSLSEKSLQHLSNYGQSVSPRLVEKKNLSAHAVWHSTSIQVLLLCVRCLSVRNSEIVLRSFCGCLPVTSKEYSHNPVNDGGAGLVADLASNTLLLPSIRLFAPLFDHHYSSNLSKFFVCVGFFLKNRVSVCPGMTFFPTALLIRNKIYGHYLYCNLVWNDPFSYLFLKINPICQSKARYRLLILVCKVSCCTLYRGLDDLASLAAHTDSS